MSNPSTQIVSKIPRFFDQIADSRSQSEHLQDDPV